MRRPVVLHVVRDWVRPSEGFVADVIGGCTATRPVVACATRWADAPVAGAAHVPVVSVDEILARTPATLVRRAGHRAPRAALAAVALRHRPAVVMAHFGYWAPHARAVARRVGSPWAVSLHGHDVLVEARHRAADGDHAMLDAIRDADLVIVPSAFLGARVEADGVDRRAIRVVGSGLALADLPFRGRRTDGGDHPVVTFAGRFVPKKGVMEAAWALAEVQRRRPQVEVRFVGTGPLEVSLRQAIATTGLRAVVLDGAQPGALRGALSRTDLLVTASRTAEDGDAETLGLVNLEAQAMGIPVVTTRHGGIPEAVSPAGAVLVDEQDDVGLAAAVVELIDHPERWAAMGRAGRRHVVARYELGARVADLEQHLVALADRGRPAHAHQMVDRGDPDPVPAGPVLPSASVVVVTHQRRDLMARTLVALDDQTLPDLQVVVVDNGTDDGTTELLARWASPEHDLDLTVIRSDSNASTSWARNLAAATATGEVLLFTDDDCRPTPTWAEAMVAGVMAGSDIVQGRTTADPALPLLPLSRTQWTPAEYGAYETANIAYRRAAFERAGGFDEALASRIAHVLGPRFAHLPFGEDTDLAWRVKRRGGASRFAVTALVEHHVFPPDPALLLRRAWVGAAFPVLVARVPELRTAMLHRRVFLGAQHERLVWALLGALTAALRGRPEPLVAAAPYVWSVLGPRRRGRVGRLRAAPVVVGRDVVELGALIYGSVRAGTPVL